MNSPDIIDYSQITETLAVYREQMQGALDSIKTELTGSMSKQWNMDIECYYRGEKAENIPIEHGWEVSNWLMSLKGISWRPSIGATVPHSVTPHAGDWKVLRYHEEWYEPAKRAHDRFNAALPDLAAYVADQDVDVDELVEVPEKIEAFVNQWHAVSQSLIGLSGQITDIGRLQDGRWSGPGARAHQHTADDMSDAAHHTVDGISQAWVFASQIGTKAVNMAANLIDIAADSADNAVWAKDLILGFDPRRWIGTVNTLLNKAIELDQQHTKTAAKAIRVIAEDAEFNALVAAHFTQLHNDFDGEIIWPRPDPDLGENW